MIKRFTFGEPFETDSVLEKPNAEKEFNDDRFWWEDGALRLTLKDDEIVYGLGETIRGINKRGWFYKSHNTDDGNHTENKQSMYGAHNFLLLDGGAADAPKKLIFVDTGVDVHYDIGYSKHNEVYVRPVKPDFDLYVIDGKDLSSVVSEFRKLIGRSYIPPKWAFGSGQSRWGYKSSDDLREVMNKMKEANIPLDMIYIDIDYMEGYRDFTINSETFKDMNELIAEMKKNNIHLIPIIDAGVKAEEGFSVYDEGHKKGYFCTDKDGKEFIVCVWPGECVFPDFINPEARHWFGMQYKKLTDLGIDGFWNDMNEPAIFYSKTRLEDVAKRVIEIASGDLNKETSGQLRNTANSIQNNPRDYDLFFHKKDGKEYVHTDLHNLYGYNMTRGASEAFDELCKDKRILLFSRSSCIGMHRYGGIWHGDNRSWFSHILLNLKLMPSLNMCGFLYSGADIGGFGDNVTEDLLLRWYALGIFTPLMRNHSALGTRRQEPYNFEKTETFKDIISIRYRLIPYLYSEYMKAAVNNTMMFKPLAFEYENDEIAKHVEDQLLLGDSIMIAPVYEQNAVGRNVYIPERMKLIRFSGGKMIDEGILEKGTHFVNIPISDVCLFLKENRILPLAKGGMNVSEVDFEDLEKVYFGNNVKPYEYYNDNGETKDYEGHIREIKVC